MIFFYNLFITISTVLLASKNDDTKPEMNEKKDHGSEVFQETSFGKVSLPIDLTALELLYLSKTNFDDLINHNLSMNLIPFHLSKHK